MKKILMSLTTLVIGSLPLCASLAQDIKGDPAVGKSKVTLCIGCHGIKGYQASFPEVYRVPMISGQGAPYIVSALTAYQKGERKHPTMRGIASTLSDQDKADVAIYFEVLGKVGAVPALGKAAIGTEAAMALVKKGACVVCHGDNFSRPINPSYPKIAGQHGDYLFAALKAYKTDDNPNVGRSNPVMRSVVMQFSNAELKELALYVSSLPGELKTVPQSDFK
ncbi:cytochrome c4 precursor [mine drainage metagenome]|uniref:Cytochrome c4 n=1 Tax=mine drainage metagenome TaxID=410659 RepID=A0A1J5PJB0_9ZZZZ